MTKTNLDDATRTAVAVLPTDVVEHMRAFLDTRSPTPALAAIRLLQELFAGCEDDADRKLRWSNVRQAASQSHAVFQSRLIDAVAAAPVTVELKRELVARIARNDFSWFFEEGRDGAYTVPMQRTVTVPPELALGQAPPRAYKKRVRDDPFEPMREEEDPPPRPLPSPIRPIRTVKTSRTEFLSRGVLHPDQAWVNSIGVSKAYEMLMPLTPGLVLTMTVEEQVRSMCEHLLPKRFKGEVLLDLCIEGEPQQWNTYPWPITYDTPLLYAARRQVLPFYDSHMDTDEGLAENPAYDPAERERLDSNPSALGRAIALVYHLSVGISPDVADGFEFSTFWPRGGPRTAEGIRTFRGYF